MITPVAVQPIQVITDAMRIFRSECVKEDIQLEFYEDPSIAEENAHWVMLDPSRVLQVIITLCSSLCQKLTTDWVFMNGMTNALKFTRDRAIREITVCIGTTTSRPSEQWDGIIFDPPTTIPQDSDNAPELGRQVFVWIKVKDTGLVSQSPTQVEIGLSGTSCWQAY
jgi:hypothetical protein